MTEFVGYEHGDMVQWREEPESLALVIIYCDECLIMNLTGKYKNMPSRTSLGSLRYLGWQVVSRVQK